jgi:hypothetical protein
MTIHSPLARRRGLTLTEALVAMFVAAIGMISLMALFPLGALQMGQALKDARCTETATNAESIMRMHWKGLFEPQTANVDTNLFNPNSSPTPDNTAFNNPTGAAMPFTPLVGMSAPVFIDPIGHFSNTNGIAGLTVLPRRNIPGVNTFGNRFRLCTLLDDMTFDESGAPVVSGARVERAGRYNWMAVLQRQNNGIAYEANVTILVFDGRAAGYVAPNSEMVYGDPSNTNRVHSFIAGGSTLQLRFPVADARPPVGKGRWVLMYTPANRLLTFHRVASLNEDNGNTTTSQFDCELQSPIPTGHDPAACRVIVLAGLAEVFERAPLTAH